MATRTRDCFEDGNSLRRSLDSGGKPPRLPSRVLRVPGHAIDAVDAGGVELLAQVVSGVGELGEQEELLLGRLGAKQVDQGLQLVVLRGSNLASLGEDTVERFGVAQQIARKARLEHVGPQPTVAARLVRGEVLIELGRLGTVMGFIPSAKRREGFLFVVEIEFPLAGVTITRI